MSFPAGRFADRFGPRGPNRVLVAGVLLFAFAYAAFAVGSTSLVVLGLPFLAAGAGIGCVETAEHAAVAAAAPAELRGSAFGLLAGVQSLGNLGASAVAGLLWTTVSLLSRSGTSRDGWFLQGPLWWWRSDSWPSGITGRLARHRGASGRDTSKPHRATPSFPRSSHIGGRQPCASGVQCGS